MKEEFVGGAKWTRAIKLGGAEAIQLWLALKAYASTHLTDGFVPDEELDTLPGAPAKPRKVMTALVGCGALERDGSRGAGLVDHAEHGWQLHDYEDHANSSTEEELRKEKARERKRLWRAEQARLLAEMRDRAGQQTGLSRGQSGTTDGTVPGTEPDNKQDNSQDCPAGPPAQAGTLTHVRERPPIPAQPSPAQPVPLRLESAAVAAPLAKPAPRRWRRVPADWQPKPDHVGLAMDLGVDLKAEETKFRDHEFRDPKSDADACFRTWLRRSIELRRQAIVAVGSQRAGDALERQMARTQALRDLERTTIQPAPKALP